MTKRKAKRIGVIDFETDPFLYGRSPEPFCGGFYDGETYHDIWSADCVTLMYDWLQLREEKYLLFAHNGGKFDFFFFVELGLVSDPLMIIASRMVKLGLGKHELRDSYSIMPFALDKYKKTEIDYDKFERSEREKHKAEIRAYLRDDCVNLFELVNAFVNRFGPMLTVGATSIKELGKLHPIRRGNATHDAEYRPFYMGGRVSAFEPGTHKGAFKIYDVNSMYPFVMRSELHPYGQDYVTMSRDIKIDSWGNIAGYPRRPYFARIIADNNGALPVRITKGKNQGLNFDVKHGEFLACAHEIRTALKYDLIKIHRVISAAIPLNVIRFDTFVDTFVAEKIAAKIAGDKITEIFTKYVVNSAYGKWGQNPAHYYDYKIKRYDARIGQEWELLIDFGEWEIWRKPTPKPRFFDVAIATSITSASRAVLLDALMRAVRPLYCDTDSIICESLNVKLSDTELGAWKLEATGTHLGIAGKKLYALYNRDPRPCPTDCKDGHPCKACGCQKMASKGANLAPYDIFRLARGEMVTYRRDSPTFRLGAPTLFIERDINRTAIPAHVGIPVT